MVEVIARILEDLLKVEGVKAALIIGRDGFVVEKVGEIPDSDAMGAISVSLLGAAEGIGNMMNAKGVDMLSVEYDNHFLLSCTINKDLFLCIMSEPSGIGKLRYEAKRIRLKLQAAL